MRVGGHLRGAGELMRSPDDETLPVLRVDGRTGEQARAHEVLAPASDAGACGCQYIASALPSPLAVHVRLPCRSGQPSDRDVRWTAGGALKSNTGHHNKQFTAVQHA